MNVIFAGTPEFAREALAAVHRAGHSIPLVLTQPDRPAGRGQHLQSSPVKRLAQALGIPVAQPTSLRRDGKHPVEAQVAQALLRATPHDVMVVAAYGLILPQDVLDLPRQGCINIHASLLPRWRGAAPIQRAIEAGDAETGITIMRMDAGLDTGPMLLRQAMPITEEDTAATLHDKLAALGGTLIVAALARLEADSLSETPQPEQGMTYASKLAKCEAALDFALPAEVLARKIRAFNPFPGATAVMDGETIKFWNAGCIAGANAGGAPGEILAADGHRLHIRCGSGVLGVTELQRAGGKHLDVAQFLAGHPLHVGARFDALHQSR